MIAIYLSPIYILLHLYLVRWLLKWLQILHPIFYKKYIKIIIICLVVSIASPLAITVLLPAGNLKSIIYRIGFLWLGTLIFISISVIVSDIVRIIIKHKKPDFITKKLFIMTGVWCLTFSICMSSYGYINAKNIKTTNYTIKINKQIKNHNDLKIVLISDLHLGYNIDNSHISKMVQKINQQQPDLVVISGDIFDNDYEAILEPNKIIQTLKNIQSKYGVYACYGNHDIQETILIGFTFDNPHDKDESDIRMDEFLKKANIHLLHDEGVLIDNSFYLFGRADRQKPGKNIKKRKTPQQITQNMNKNLPIIVLDHQPDQLQDLADAGVDLDLSGHTHNGQIFPCNILTSFIWENSYGCIQKDNMYSITTSGVGLFGPFMRIGSNGEICTITIRFK